MSNIFLPCPKNIYYKYNTVSLKYHYTSLLPTRILIFSRTLLNLTTPSGMTCTGTGKVLNGFPNTTKMAIRRLKIFSAINSLLMYPSHTNLIQSDHWQYIFGFASEKKVPKLRTSPQRRHYITSKRGQVGIFNSSCRSLTCQNAFLYLISFLLFCSKFKFNNYSMMHMDEDLPLTGTLSIPI